MQKVCITHQWGNILIGYIKSFNEKIKKIYIIRFILLLILTFMEEILSVKILSERYDAHFSE